MEVVLFPSQKSKQVEELMISYGQIPDAKTAAEIDMFRIQKEFALESLRAEQKRFLKRNSVGLELSILRKLKRRMMSNV